MHIHTERFVERLDEMVEAGCLTEEEAERLREADAILERLENGELLRFPRGHWRAFRRGGFPGRGPGFSPLPHHAVMCAFVAVTLAAALVALRRRDARSSVSGPQLAATRWHGRHPHRRRPHLTTSPRRGQALETGI